MAKSYVSTNGTLYIPGAYSSYTVQTANSGLATTGVLMLVGEADAGPDYTLETDVELNAFGPTQLTSVIAKYKSGPLVDAFRIATAPTNDPGITGAFNSAIIVKTNVSTKATGTLPRIGGGTYSALADVSYGVFGNNTQFQTSSAQAEVVPTTGLFTYIPAVGTVGYDVRVNGGAGLTSASLAANTPPNTFVSTFAGVSGLTASGGVNRNIITVSGTIAIAVVSGNTITATRSVNWAVTPSIGDTFIIPSGSTYAGAGNANVGAYVVTAATVTVITATKLSDAGKAGGVAGTITAPVAVSATSIVALTDVAAYSPVSISLAPANVIDGVGKSLELCELTSGTDLLSRTTYVLGTTTAVTWVSKASAPTNLVSSAEYKVKLALLRTSDNYSESFTAGGEVGLKIGYNGTTATVSLTATTLTTTVTGGSGTSLSLTISNYPTVQALASFINAQPGYSCAPGTAAVGLLPPVALDDVVNAGICSTEGAQNGRIKTDAYRFGAAVSGSLLVQFGNPVVLPTLGIPDVLAVPSYLSGGTRGGTSDAQVANALTALTNVQGNFLIPLFSRNATLDIVGGTTDPSSTYTIAATHANCSSHVSAMSTFKRQKNRQAFLSIEDSFANQLLAAANVANFRCSMVLQDFKQTGSTGSIVQFQPWMGAVIAAAAQAAAFYKNIENKVLNTSGVIQLAGDFTAKNDDQVTQALQGGLMPARRSPTGAYVFVSDQTTYGVDSNFVYNSIQAIYASDTVSLTTAQRMATAFVGQSVADISAPVALSFLESVMADMLRLKLIAPSSDAPKGFKNATISINGNVMLVNLEIKLAVAIDFIPISFLVSPVQQTASQ